MKALSLCLALLSVSCTGALSGGTISGNPFKQVQPQAPPPYDGHVKTISSWQDSSAATQGFTNAITINVDCDDPNAVTKAQAILASDSRSVIWFFNGIAYGAEGYELRADAAECWARERDLIIAKRSASIAVWLADEPADVAWSFWPLVNGVATYDPNRYNGVLEAGGVLVHADFPDLPVAFNYGSLPAGTTVPNGINLLGLEAYDASWQGKLQTLETKFLGPIWLMPPAFVDGDPTTQDPILAQRVRDEWTWMQHDQRVTGIYFFLWCCTDLVTGDKSFYTISDSLPLTRQAIQDVGAAVLK